MLGVFYYLKKSRRAGLYLFPRDCALLYTTLEVHENCSFDFLKVFSMIPKIE